MSSDLLQLYTVKGNPLPNNYITTGYMTWSNILDNGATSTAYLIDGWSSPNLIVLSDPSNNILVQPTSNPTSSPPQVGFKFAQQGIYELTINMAFGYANLPNSNWNHVIALSTSPTTIITPGNANTANTGGYGLYSSSYPSAIMYQNLSGNTLSTSSSTPINIVQKTINGYGGTSNSSEYWAFAYFIPQQYNSLGLANNNTYTLKATVYAETDSIIYPISQIYSGSSSNEGNYVCMGPTPGSPYLLPFTCKLLKTGTP